MPVYQEIANRPMRNGDVLSMTYRDGVVPDFPELPYYCVAYYRKRTETMKEDNTTRLWFEQINLENFLEMSLAIEAYQIRSTRDDDGVASSGIIN